MHSQFLSRLLSQPFDPLPRSLSVLNSNLPTKVFRVPQTGRQTAPLPPVCWWQLVTSCRGLRPRGPAVRGLPVGPAWAAQRGSLRTTAAYEVSSEEEVTSSPSRSRRGNGFRDGCHTDPFHCPTPPLISTNPGPLAFQSLNFPSACRPFLLSSLSVPPFALTHGSNLGALRWTERMCGWAQGRVSTLYISFLSSPL